MSVDQSTKLPLKALSLRQRFAQSTSGVAALEFGMVAPIMLAMFLGTVEFSQAITVDRRVSQVASSTADLVARQKTLTTTALDGYMLLIGQLMQPYSPSLLKLTIANVYATVAAPANPLVCWSYNRNDNGTPKGVNTYSNGQSYPLPTGIVEGGTSVVVVEVQYDYEPLIFRYFIKSTMPMKETFYLKPRLSASVQLGSATPCV